MRMYLILPVVLLLGSAYGCTRSPVVPATRDVQPASELTVTSTDTTGRGGNVMGGGH